MTTYVTAGENGIEVTVGMLTRNQLDAANNAEGPSATNEFVTVSALAGYVAEAGDTNLEVVLARGAGNISAPAASLSARLVLAEMDTYNALAYGMAPANTAAANTAALNALLASDRRIVIPEGEYSIQAYSGGATGITLDNISNLHLQMHPGTVLRVSPTAEGVTAYHAIKVPDTASNIVIEGGRIEGDKETHLLTDPLASTTLTAALTGGESSLTVADTSAFGTATRNLIVVADNGTRHHATYTVTNGTTLGLQTNVPAGFVASIGADVYDAKGENGINVRIDGAENVTLLNMQSNNAWTDGYYITSTSRNITLINCSADLNRRQGLSIVGGSNIRVFGGSFTNTQGALPQHGIDVEPSGTYFVEDVEFHGVTCTGNRRDGLRVLGIIPRVADEDHANGAVHRVKVFGGLFTDNAWFGLAIFRSGGHLVHGATVRDNVRDGIYLLGDDTQLAEDGVTPVVLDCDRNTISNCISEENGEYGLLLEAQGAASCEANTIIGGHIRDNGDGGVALIAAHFNTLRDSFVASNGGNGVLLTDSDHNIVAVHATRSAIRGVRLDTSHYNQIAGHINRNQYDGVLLVGSSDNEIVARVVDNSQLADDTYYGIDLQTNSDRNWIHGCLVFRGDGANQQRYGIRIATADCDANRIEYNRLIAAGKTGTHTNSGTGSVIANNALT